MNDRYLPEEISDRIYYEAKRSGVEAEIRERLERWRKGREGRERSSEG
jgi:replication-associated recombination protein RarA